MFYKKSIRVLIQKTQGEFQEGVNTLEFKDLPIEAVINRTGESSESTIKIYGISKEHINSITWLPNLGIKQDAPLKVALYVDEGKGEFLLYVGIIRDACPEYMEAPDVCIDIKCYTLAFQNLMGSIPPTSFTGEARVPDIYRAVCASYKVPFYDRTVKEMPMVQPPVLDQSSILLRLKALKEAYPDVIFEEFNGTIYIYNRDFARVKYTFTPEDFIGYPRFNQYGISLFFDRVIGIKRDESIEIKGSEIESINRSWIVISAKYNISTKIGGKWQMELGCKKFSEDNDDS